jgi:uncharacterized protein
MHAMLDAADRAVTNSSAGRSAGRRLLLKLAGTGAVILGLLSMAGGTALAQGTLAWDKTFPRSTRVDHQKVSFSNRLGISLVGDLYVPKNLDRSRRYPAIIVGHPYGGVKEQTSGLYAQTMAERGFITLAFDASYNGESGGQPHFIASPEAFVEDFSAAVDYLGRNTLVDRDRIGVIGVCGSGGFSLAAAQIDPRIRAVATVSMYDIGQAARQGLAESVDTAALKRSLERVAAQRWAEVDGAERTMVIGTPEAITGRSTEIDREFYDYYRTPRGHHPRSTTAMTLTSSAPMSLFSAFEHLDWISPRPVLFITGDRAHSRLFSEQAYERASRPKELYVVPGAGHVDLYDRVNLIPWNKLASFFTQHLAERARALVGSAALIRRQSMSKVYFITGTGRGMGVDFARAALAAGHRVLATARRPEAVTEAAGANENLLAVTLDITDPAQAEAAVNAAVARFGRIDVLVNNAAIFQAGFFEEVSPEQFRAQVEVNFFGALNVTRAVLPVMRRQRRGQIVTITSLAGVVAGQFTSAYAASKFALEGWMEALRPEVAPYGITTTIVEPGFFRTKLLEKESTILPALSVDDYAERTAQTIPVWESMNGKQSGDPAKLGRALVTLLDSPAPPERWVAGSDAVRGVVQKAELLRQQASAFPEVSTTLDHDEAA